MELIDTHTHLYLEEFDADGGGSAAVRRAIEAGVRRMVMPNVGLDTIRGMEALAAAFPGAVYLAAGLHPTEVGDSWAEDTDAALSAYDPAKGYVAVGEVGIDLYWEQDREREQMLSLDRQLSFAVQRDLPVIIHCREGLDQTLEVMQGHPGVRAVFHSFGGNVDDVRRIRRHGDHYFGINGIVTFKNCHVRDTLPEIGLDRLLLETDSPYLAPVPHRGKRNESALLPCTALHIASHLGLDTEQVAEVTTANAVRFFSLPVTPPSTIL